MSKKQDDDWSDEEYKKTLDEIDEEDLEDEVGDLLGDTDGPLTVNLINMRAEGVVVNGIRQTPTVITFSPTAERDPERDAAEIETKLAYCLGEKTFNLLCERIYKNHIKPNIEMAQAFEKVLHENVSKMQENLQAKKRGKTNKEPDSE